MARGYRPGGRTYVSGYATVKPGVQKSEVYNPKPLKGIPKDDIRPVDYSTPIWTHRQMNLRAVEFQKEMELTSAPWTYLNHPSGQIDIEDDVNACGYLFGDHRKRVVGACAFRHRGGHWIMQWVWFTPDAWHQGHLRMAWAYFRRVYGDFLIDDFQTAAMVDFLYKNTKNQ